MTFFVAKKHKYATSVHWPFQWPSYCVFWYRQIQHEALYQYIPQHRN